MLLIITLIVLVLSMTLVAVDNSILSLINNKSIFDLKLTIQRKWFWIVLLKLKFLGYLGNTLCVVALLAALVCNIISSQTIADMKSLYVDNNKIFIEASDKYSAATKTTYDQGAVIVTTVPYFYTETIIKYNKNITWYKMYQNHWFFDMFVGKIPAELSSLPLVEPVDPLTETISNIINTLDKQGKELKK